MVAPELNQERKSFVPRRHGFRLSSIGFAGGDFWKRFHCLEVGFAAQVGEHGFAARPGSERALVVFDAPNFAKQIALGLLGLAK